MTAQLLRVLVADDEATARKRLTRLLSAIDGVDLVEICTDGTEVLEALQRTEVDLCILDVQMTELTGIETMALMGDADPLIIFVTAHPDFAVDAFEGGAVDYLLKPFDAARLKKAIDRARDRFEAGGAGQGEAPDPTSSAAPRKRLAVPTRKGLVLLNPAELHHAVLDGESLMLTTARGTFVTDFRIATLEEKLDDPRFERVHRKALINLDHIDTLEPLGTGGYVARMKGGGQVPISRQAARKLRKMWGLPKG